MPLLSALEDLSQRSLAALPTLWDRLRFLAELRGSFGEYQHWGLEQKYGKSAAQSAISEAHAEAVAAFSSTQLVELWQSANQVASREQVDVEEYLKRAGGSENALPEELDGVVPEHYRFVMTNLSRVARYRSASTHLAA